MADTERPASKPGKPHWQQAALVGLASIEGRALPGVEVLLLDDVAGYVMGSGPLPGPYTVEHGTRVVSGLLRAIVDGPRYEPASVPAETAGISAARAAFVTGAHELADLGVEGVLRVANRLIPAVVGELERQRDAPEQQARALFTYAMLAVASGPSNKLSDDAAAGVSETFYAWDELFGKGFVPPWRAPASA